MTGIVLDFSKCKTPEDVDKVFAKHKKDFAKIRKQIKKLTTKKESG